MKITLNSFLLLLIFVVFGCGSKPVPQTLADKIENIEHKVESEVKKTDEKIAQKVGEIEKKEHASPKKLAPVAVSFELKDDKIIVTIHLNKPVKNLVIQANPLDGLSIQPVIPSANSSFDEPTTLTLQVELNNKVGRLGIYIAGSFDGRQLAHSQTYDFPGANDLSKKKSKGERDGNGDLIRVMPAKEK